MFLLDLEEISQCTVFGPKLRFAATKAAALRAGRVDLEKRRIRVVVTFAEVDGRLVEQPPKNGKFRTVPVPRSLVPELRPFVDGRCSDDLVFTTKRGASLRIRNWRNREFALEVKAAKLDGLGLTPHELRHTAASLAIAAGVSVKVVQAMLGHRTAAMTPDWYGHLFPDRLDAARRQVPAA